MQPDTLNAPVRRFGFKQIEKLQAQHRANEHLFGFEYWHFFDIGTDAVRAALKPAVTLAEKTATATSLVAKALPLAKLFGRALPVVGVAGEAMHVTGPFKSAKQDWQNGELTTAQFGGMCAGYAAYALLGLGGITTVAVKEGLMTYLQKKNVMPARYIPHTLYQELQHSGTIRPNLIEDWCESALGALTPATTITKPRAIVKQHG